MLKSFLTLWAIECLELGKQETIIYNNLRALYQLSCSQFILFNASQTWWTGYGDLFSILFTGALISAFIKLWKRVYMQAETILWVIWITRLQKNVKLHFIPKTNYCELYWLEWFLLTHSDAEVMVQIETWSKRANLARKQEGDRPEKKFGMISSCNRWKNWIMSTVKQH